MLAALALTASLVTAPATTAAAAEPPAGESVVDYTTSDVVVANPDRGFYHHTETHYDESGNGYVPLSAAPLAAWRAEGVSQVQRVVYMEKFADQPVLDDAWLDLVEADFDTARDAGVSLVLRFAYLPGQGSWPYSAPYGDADLPTVLGHIEQLTPVLQAGSDVVSVLQAGFIGYWGEWYYTDHFVADPANPGTVTPADWAKRRQVAEALLDALPDDRMLAVRTMRIKQELFGVPTGAAGALTPAQAHGGSDIARVGFHHDCFLASENDFGTFLSSPLELDREYLELDSRYVPVGGETCNVNAPRSEYPSARADMARYHWSHLSDDYLRPVLDSWGPAGLAETRNRLGYRFAMTQSRVTTAATADGGAVTLEVDVENSGWAAPTAERPVRLVLTGADLTEHVIPVDTDPRHWGPGTTSTLAVDVCDVPVGTYSAALALPAARPTIADDPRYAVQLVNDGVWDPATGRNDLGQQVVVGQAAAQCGGPTDLDVAASVSPSTVTVGQQVVVTAAVTNNGPFAGPTGADLVLDAPAGLVLRPASTSAPAMACTTTEQRLACRIPSLALGDTATATVRAAVVAVPTTALAVSVTGDRFDGIPANDEVAPRLAVAPAPSGSGGPVDPGPVGPEPVDPGPVDPGPVGPGPVDPGPVGPEPVDPEPVGPGPVDPGPVGPEPVDPEPQAPGPSASDPDSGGPAPDGSGAGSGDHGAGDDSAGDRDAAADGTGGARLVDARAVPSSLLVGGGAGGTDGSRSTGGDGSASSAVGHDRLARTGPAGLLPAGALALLLVGAGLTLVRRRAA